jgi:O-antigen/teichoic acid export membrane protein
VRGSKAEKTKVRISFAGILGRLPQSRLTAAAAPYARILDNIVSGSDDRAVSQRIVAGAFTIRIVSALIMYVSQVFLARWMGDFEYGIFAVVWVGAIIAGSLACLGAQTAVTRFIPEYLHRKEDGLVRGVLFGSRVFGFAVATFFALLGLLGLYFFGHAISSYYIVPLYLAAIVLPMLAIGEIHEGIARSFSFANLALWQTFILRPILILVFMAAAILFGAPADAVTAMGATVVATYLTSVGQFLGLQYRIRKTVPRGPRIFKPALWIGVALPMFLLEGFFNLLTNVDILIVGYLVDPDKAAVYFAAVKTLVLVQFVYFAVRVGGAQRFSQYYAAGDHTRLRAFVRDTLHWTFWPSLAMIVFLFAVGKPLLLLFGPTFGEGYPLLFILSIGLLVRASIGPAESLLPMAGQQGICAAVYTGAFVLNVILNFTFIPLFGLKGAAIATSTTLVIETIALYWATASRLGIRSWILTAWRPLRPMTETS